MKSKHVVFCLVTALINAALVSTLASGSEAALKPLEAKTRMEAACREIGTLRSNIFLTLTELDLVRSAENRQAQYQKFNRQLTNMREQVNLTAERVRIMKEKGRAYFADWETMTKEIQEPEKRKEAESRYAVRKDSYDRIFENLQTAKANFEPLLDDFLQIQKLLEGTPDPAKVAAAKQAFAHANWHCIDVQRALMQVELQFTFLGGDFALNDAGPEK